MRAASRLHAAIRKAHSVHVTCLVVGGNGQTYCLVTARLRAAGGLQEPRARELFRHILIGMAYCHGRKLAHR
jgi:serine/threonine protein kinase